MQFHLAAFGDEHDQSHCLLLNASELDCFGGRQFDDGKALEEPNDCIGGFGQSKIHLRLG